MSAQAATTERLRSARPARRRQRRGPAPAADCRDGFGATLEDVVISTLAELSGAGRSTCPVCDSPSLEPGGCTACSSHLS